MPGILTVVKTLLSTQLTLSPRLLALIKKGWKLFSRCRLISTFRRKKHAGARSRQDQLIDWIRPNPTAVRPSKGQSSVLQATDHTVAGSHPSALRVAAHGQQAAPLEGVTPLQRCSRRILQPQPTGRGFRSVYGIFVLDTCIWSAFSFPCVPMWLGIHVRMILLFLKQVCILSSSLVIRGVDEFLLCRAWRTD